MFQKSNWMERLEDILMGFTLALPVVYLWELIHNNPHATNYGSCWWLLWFITGSVLIRRRRLRQKSASMVLSEDQRAPVVYLRSFQDDQTTSRPLQENSSPVFYTEEEYLMNVLND